MSKTVCQNTLPFHSHRNITARFDGGSLTSDAGWLLFGSLDRQHRLCEGFSSCISESRDQRYIRHDLLKLIRQRVLQIVAGYEDCNDADTLRSDPMLKTVCDQLPESDPDLATQPTFSRLENSVTKKDLMRLSRWLLGRYVRSLKKRRPSKIILDLDSTDDHTHGQQEFSFYHGYYRNHILHPLLIFDADTGDLVCAVLRPGNKGAASHIVPILKRVVEAIRQAVGTDVEIEIRADSGFATPRLYEFCECEENKLQYVIGLSRNPRLQRVVEPLLDSTRERFLELEEKQRQFDEFLYRAHSWDRSRRVIVKVEVDQRGINRRFVVTNRDDLCSQSLYDHYTNRGQTENFIKASGADQLHEGSTIQPSIWSGDRLLYRSSSIPGSGQSVSSDSSCMHWQRIQMFVRNSLPQPLKRACATIFTEPPGTSSKSKPYVVGSSRLGPGSDKPLDASGSIFPQPFPNNPSSTSS